jgi:hypothetical protein
MTKGLETKHIIAYAGISVLAIAGIIVGLAGSWMKVTVSSSLAPIDAYLVLFLNGGASYVSGTKREDFKYADADTGIGTSCVTSSNAALALGIIAAILLGIFLVLITLFRQKNLFQKPYNFVIFAILLISLVFQIAGVASFRGNNCLAKFVDSLKNGENVGITFKASDDYGFILAVVAIVLTAVDFVIFAIQFKKN